MKLIRCLLTAAAFQAGAGFLHAQEAPPVALAANASKYSFPTTAGQVYEIQGSDDGTVWTKVAGPIFGDGNAATGLLPAGKQYASLRTHPIDPAGIGPAPVGFRFQSLALHDGTTSGSLFFKDATSGVLRRGSMAALIFTSVWQRTAADEGVVSLSFRTGTTATLRLKWLGKEGGSYEITYSTHERDAGVFSLHKGLLRSDASVGVLPATLESQTVIMREGARVIRYSLTPEGDVHVTDNRRTEITGTWDFRRRSAQKGDLEINIPGLPAAVYELNLTADRSGVFNREGAPAGAGGPFSIGGPDPVANPDCPPAELTGRSILFAGSKVIVLSFNADGEGISVCDNEGVLEVTAFSYSYSTRAGGQAGLVITYPGVVENVVDEYDLDFSDDCDGNYTRRPTQGEIAGATSRGEFSQDVLGAR